MWAHHCLKKSAVNEADWRKLRKAQTVLLIEQCENDHCSQKIRSLGEKRFIRCSDEPEFGRQEKLNPQAWQSPKRLEIRGKPGGSANKWLRYKANITNSASFVFGSFAKLSFAQSRLQVAEPQPNHPHQPSLVAGSNQRLNRLFRRMLMTFWWIWSSQDHPAESCPCPDLRAVAPWLLFQGDRLIKRLLWLWRTKLIMGALCVRLGTPPPSRMIPTSIHQQTGQNGKLFQRK